MPLPSKKYYSLTNLVKRWGVEEEDIKYHIEHGDLKTCCWLDLRSVMRYQPTNGGNAMTVYNENFEGYVGLKPQDCRKIFRCGQYKLVHFLDLEQEGFEIALLPQSRDALISISDIVVSKEECRVFEKSHGLYNDKKSVPCKARMLGKVDVQSKISRANTDLHINQSKQEYHYRGKLLNFGAIQSNIINQLVEVHDTDAPWVHGKTLLYNAGSQAIRMRDLFKSQPLWREIIESDKRGHYRISSELQVAKI
jgi:hypothetical protein